MSESQRMKKTRKKERGEGGEQQEDPEVRDPLVVCGPDILRMILSNLEARSVALCIMICRGWREVASSDAIWSRKCKELWSGKAHIPRFLMTQGISRLAAYSFSIMDGRRARIMKEDLCDHVWEYRFKEAAPLYFRELDPSWTGTGPPLRRYFHPDGSLTADPLDKVWGGHECTYLMVTSFVGEGRIREHYVRINRWPKMSVSRNPDWSWNMANHLYCYKSIPDPEKEGGTGPPFPFW